MISNFILIICNAFHKAYIPSENWYKIALFSERIFMKSKIGYEWSQSFHFQKYMPQDIRW